MSASLKELQTQLDKLAKKFPSEENVFRKTLTIFKFMEILRKNKEVKSALSSILSETNQGMDYSELLSAREDILSDRAGIDCDFWVCYGALEKIYKLILKFKTTKDKHYVEKAGELISASYYPEIYQLCFKMVSGCILARIEAEYLLTNKKEKSKKTWFDVDHSLLHVRGYKIPIAIQDKETNAHKILQHIFQNHKEDISDKFFYSELADDIFEDREYHTSHNAWQKYYDTCKKINEKITEGTKNVVDNFLIFNSGQTGYLKINLEYL